MRTWLGQPALSEGGCIDKRLLCRCIERQCEAATLLLHILSPCL